MQVGCGRDGPVNKVHESMSASDIASYRHRIAADVGIGTGNPTVRKRNDPRGAMLEWSRRTSCFTTSGEAKGLKDFVAKTGAAYGVGFVR